MNKGKVFKEINRRVKKGEKSYWILLDPDDFSSKEAGERAAAAQKAGADAVLVGGSLLQYDTVDNFVKEIKKRVSLPVILFPGDATQLCECADAVLFLSLVSGRNPVMLIGEHVKGAPVIKKMGLEPVPTAYMLVESGSVSSVEFMSNTRPLPRNKPEIAAAHALAASYMGMGLIYLEAGSGAEKSVPAEIIRHVKNIVDIPVITGGGIRDGKSAAQKVRAGADIIVTGTVLGRRDYKKKMEEIARAVKGQHLNCQM